jgi:hypothetical protein
MIFIRSPAVTAIVMVLTGLLSVCSAKAEAHTDRLSSRSDRTADIAEGLSRADAVEKLNFLLRSQFLRQQAGFEKKALRVRQKG